MKLWRWLVALFTIRMLRRGKPPTPPEVEDRERIVPAGSQQRRAENVVLALLGIACFFALAFVAVYAEFSPKALPDQLLGICCGLCLVFIGAALTVVAKRLVVTEEIEDDYPEEHPKAQQEIVDIVHQSGSRFTRKRLLLGAGLGTGAVVSAATLTPVLSLGPIWDTGPLDVSPWKKGVRLVDEAAKPMLASDIDERTYYTAFAEGTDMENLASPLIVLRLDPAKLTLPRGRKGWAPQGILAFSKICTHAGCAVALYRKPTYTPVEPNVALVCPCHYSTFDPFTGGSVVYGPAGRPLPQLPLMIDSAGYLAASGNFSARVGPGWWNVLSKPSYQPDPPS